MQIIVKSLCINMLMLHLPGRPKQITLTKPRVKESLKVFIWWQQSSNSQAQVMILLVSYSLNHEVWETSSERPTFTLEDSQACRI